MESFTRESLGIKKKKKTDRKPKQLSEEWSQTLQLWFLGEGGR